MTGSRVRLAIIVVLLAVTVGVLDSAVAAQSAASNRLTWAGKSRFSGGANLPWYNWGCDFGCGAKSGVSSPDVRSAVAARVGQLRRTGLDTVRWWLLEPAQPGVIWQIAPGSNGRLRLDPGVYTDLDAALQIAEQEDVYFVFVLFAGVGPEHLPPAWLNDSAQRQELADALAPLFSKYAGHKRILAWELFNEPEWQIWRGEASEEDTVALARLLVDTIRPRTSTLITIGSAMIDGIPMWRNVDLDFYSPHWYQNMSSGGWCALCRDYASIASQYGITKPIVIGEWDGAPGSGADKRWQHWLDAGYAGAWGWSLFPDHTSDQISFDFGVAASFVTANGAAVAGGDGAPVTTPAPSTGAPVSGALPQRGSFALLVTTQDTTAQQVVGAMGGACATSTVGILRDGQWRIYVAGAPASVNLGFPAALPAGTPLFARC